MNLFKKIDKEDVIVAIIFILFFAFIFGSIYYMYQYTEHKYTLYEMNDGVYAIYYTTHSNVPANNYEVVTLCCGGNVFTFRGNVFISFTDGEPYAIVKNYNMVNDDDIYVYVPQGTVSYRSSVHIGK